jgi:hypothetical protein
LNLVESPVKAQLLGSSSGGSGPDLTGYPHLVYAPAQWGEGVRVASNGAHADRIGSGVAEHPLPHVALVSGVTLEEALDCYRYAFDNNLLGVPGY